MASWKGAQDVHAKIGSKLILMDIVLRDHVSDCKHLATIDRALCA